MLNEYLITIDTDWASDSIIAQVANFLIENEIKSTWFVTHESPEIRGGDRYIFQRIGPINKNQWTVLGDDNI